LFETLVVASAFALFAASVAIAVTVLIERVGGMAGGLFGTLPTTIVPASLGVWSHDAVAMLDAMSAVPIGMFINAGFLWLWRIAPPHLPAAWSLHRRLAAMTVLSLSAWALAALGLTLFLRWAHTAGVSSWALGLGGLALLVLSGLLGTAKPIPAPRGGRRVKRSSLLLRGLLAGVAVGTAIVIARGGHPTAAGVAAVFPAIFLTAMVSLWLSQGEAVPAGAVGPMMLGSASVGGYALFAAALFPLYPAPVAALLAWVLAVLTTTLPGWFWLRARSR
jgi:hypothetical protein